MKGKLIIKRRLDFIVSLCAIVIFSWLFLLIAVTIRVESRGPIIFKQKRIGVLKKEFYIYKFRTMYSVTPKDVPTHELKEASYYITKVGAFLRKTSLDELPQLINIIRGDMSFVGPRPALWNQYDLIVERDKYHANDVIPGITGWAQINGRDELPISIKAAYDGEYVEKWSIGFDIKCIIKTVLYVFKQEGIREGM